MCVVLGGGGVSDSLVKVVGNGEGTSFWSEPWVAGGLLRSRFPRLYNLSTD